MVEECFIYEKVGFPLTSMMSFIEDSFPQLIFEGIPVPSLHLKLAKPIFAVLPFD